MVFSHILNFLIDYFTNLNAKKVFGGILVLIGMSIIGRTGVSGNADKAVLYAICGILLAGVGLVVIYFDIAKDKIGRKHDELGTLTKAYEQKEREERKISTWHLDQKAEKKNTDIN